MNHFFNMAGDAFVELCPRIWGFADAIEAIADNNTTQTQYVYPQPLPDL